MQWQRAHVAAANIKHENHDMALVFGNETADAVAKQEANEAALRGAAAEQVAWLYALAWQVQRRIVEANLQASKAAKRVSGGHSTKPSCSHFSNKLHASWHFGVRGKGVNVRFAGEIQTMQSIGNSLGLGVTRVRAGAKTFQLGAKIIHLSNSVAQYRGITWCWNCAAWTSRSLCGLSTQCSGMIKASARDALSRIKRRYPPRAKMSWPLPATGQEKMLEWQLAVPVVAAAPI